jgi:hypothetical protein
MTPDLKLGKKPARPDSVTFKLRNYLAPAPPPAKAGHFKLQHVWGMLGNQLWGDCVLAGAGHETMLWNTEAGKIVAITEHNALSDYSALTGFNPDDPSTDQGTDMQEAASYRRKTGIVDAQQKRHKVSAYLAITAGSVAQLKQAIYEFSAVGIGFNFPSSAMAQFNNHKPWTVVKGSQIEGGHYVPAVGYDADYIYVITWGAVQKMSWAFYKKYCDEAIAYLSSEFLKDGKSLEGFNAAQLAADLKKL